MKRESGLRYVGDGEWIPGVPARDLDAAEAARYGAVIRANERATGKRLYAPVEPEPGFDTLRYSTDGFGSTDGVSAGSTDDLKAIRGIGPRTAEALGSLGVESYTDLAAWDTEALARALDGSSVAQVERWQGQALAMLSRSE